MKYEGDLKKAPTDQIYLNINHLKKGKYSLKIVDKNKIIKKTKFIKK